MVLRMGGTMPPSALLLPIVLRDRVVAADGTGGVLVQ
jgi:hypothetical protein